MLLLLIKIDKILTVSLAPYKAIKLAPVAIFAFNRPDHLRKCLDSLQNNKEAKATEFWIFVDGPRNEEDLFKRNLIKKLLIEYKQFLKIRITFAEKNLGLAKSIISGLHEVFSFSDRAIIVEDDLITSQFFLDFCNSGLDLFESNQNVASIHGFSYKFKSLESAPYFIKGADCWGWATWKNRWELFEENSETLIRELEKRHLKRKFNLDGSYPYFNMLSRQSRGEIDSWAIRWHASMFLANKLTLYPNQTLINNIGIDGSGTHAGQGKNINSILSSTPINITKMEAVESVKARRKLKHFLRNHYGIRYRLSPMRMIIGIKRKLQQKS